MDAAAAVPIRGIEAQFCYGRRGLRFDLFPPQYDAICLSISSP
jgi:hypothetical protein